MKWRTDYVNANIDSWETDVVYGCAMLLNLEQVVKHELFLDENLFLYCDELDLCIRAKRKKLKVVMAGKARIYHKEASSYNSDLKPTFVFYALRNRILLAHKFLSPLEMVLFWFLFTGSRLIRCVQWIFEGKFELIKATWLSFKDGIRRKGGKKCMH